MHTNRIRSLIAGVGLSLIGLGCQTGSDVPDPDSETYTRAVSAFYAGVAAVQSGSDLGADERFLAVTELAPGEPSAWANLGLLALRQNEFEQAATYFEQALMHGSNHSAIQVLIGQMLSLQGQTQEAETRFRQAIELDSLNVKALYALAVTLGQDATPEHQAEQQALLADILVIQPSNLAVLIERAAVAGRQGDLDGMSQMVAQLNDVSSRWPAEARTQLEAVRAALDANNTGDALTQLTFLRNILLRDVAYREGLAAIQTPVEDVGELITHFIRMPSPSATPAPPDTGLSFIPEAAWTDLQVRHSVLAVALDAQSLPTLIAANGETVRIGERVFQASEGNVALVDRIEPVDLSFPGGSSAEAPSIHAIAALDFNYDFRMDLALAGAGGFRLYSQDSTGFFTDITQELGQTERTAVAYSGVWAADLDLEGDIDLVLGTLNGATTVLRNNGDGTLQPWPLFEEVQALREFIWADLDIDGDPDAVLLDQTGTLHLYWNLRSGQFETRAVPEDLGSIRAVQVADLNRDAQFELIVLQQDGTIISLSSEATGEGWQRQVLARWSDMPDSVESGSIRLFTPDLDNNGSLDVLVSTPSESRIWLGGQSGAFRMQAQLDEQIYAAIPTEEGRLDLLGHAEAGGISRWLNRGVEPYHWKLMHTQAAQALGDQRINSFGIGGEIELRAGLLFQKQLITTPLSHFGLGNHMVADVARIIWPNGDVQAEFDLVSNVTVSAQQRLKGSCPWLFTFNGEQMQFVTDFLWRSPLGLRINAQETAGIMTTEDWVRIRGDQLVPRDGYYDIRITAELWETHFFDHVSLMVVDHPEDVDIFIDERFAIPPPPFSVHPMSKSRPVTRAWDDTGLDVTDVIRVRDQHYLDTFGRGRYQGITRDHYVEIELGEDVPADQPLWLIASGWVRPTDSSINVAISQGEQELPQSLRLEVQDQHGDWVVVRTDLGFPSGKEKSILIDLTDLFEVADRRRLRLATNLEVYWDAIHWATDQSEVPLQVQQFGPEIAELRYRGFSVVAAADRSSPELPDYQQLKTRAQVWRDLEGYYTRYGAVGALLDSVDDRYVIMNAGDELIFKFPVPPPPSSGWTRDFVLIGDGWVKDGDYNTTFSKTVLPLPSHQMSNYVNPPISLEKDPVFRHNAGDWKTYHTRYVVAKRFQEALVSNSRLD